MFATYKYHGCNVTECIKVDEFLDLSRQSKKNRVHDIAQVASKLRDVVTWIGARLC